MLFEVLLIGYEVNSAIAVSMFFAKNFVWPSQEVKKKTKQQNVKVHLF